MNTAIYLGLKTALIQKAAEVPATAQPATNPVDVKDVAGYGLGAFSALGGGLAAYDEANTHLGGYLDKLQRVADLKSRLGRNFDAALRAVNATNFDPNGYFDHFTALKRLKHVKSPVIKPVVEALNNYDVDRARVLAENIRKRWRKRWNGPSPGLDRVARNLNPMDLNLKTLKTLRKPLAGAAGLVGGALLGTGAKALSDMALGNTNG